MQFLLRRYRDLTLLVLVMVSQLLLLAWQVRTGQDVRLIRVWAVSGIMPLARVVEFFRANSVGAIKEYVVLWDAKGENRELKEEVGKLRMENHYLKNELATADRARALAVFQSSSPSKTLAARLIGSATGANSRVVYIDRGSNSGVQKGMAVVTPSGIAGKIVASYPGVSQMMLVTDPAFAAGVISRRNKVLGTLKGQGSNVTLVDYVQNEEDVKEGDWFYTSGDDRIFPKGLPVGQVRLSRHGRTFKEIHIAPSGIQDGIEEVLIVLDGVHQSIPEAGETSQKLHMLERPPAESSPDKMIDFSSTGSKVATDADQVMQKYRRIGAAQGHEYGGGGVPNFNITPPPPAAEPKPPPQTPAPKQP